MNIDLKWNFRQALLSFLTLPFSFSSVVLIKVAIRALQFYSQGFAMYPWIRIPKNYDLHFALHAFWDVSVSPVIFWLILTLPIDCLIRRFFFKLGE